MCHMYYKNCELIILTYLSKRPLSKQMTLNSGQRLVRIIIGLFYKT